MLSALSAAATEVIPEAVLDGTSVGVVRIAESGEITHINAVWRQFVADNRQYEATCVGLGENYLDACERSGHDWARQVAEGIRAVIGSERDYFQASYSCHSPTRLRWFRLHARRAPDGSPAVVLTHIDSTEQQLALARSRIQGCVANTFTARTSLRVSCRELARIVCQELAWDGLAVWSLDTASWQLRCEDSWMRPELGLEAYEAELHNERHAPGSGLPGRVWNSRTPEWVMAQGPAANDGHETLSARARAAGFGSGFAFAVKYDDDVLAIIEILGRMHKAPDRELMALLEVAGVQLATAELRERAEFRATAAQSEADAAREQLEAVLACVPALVVAIDRDGALRFVNRELQPMAAQDERGPAWQSYVPQSSVPAIQSALQVVLAGGPPQTQDATVTAPDGKTTWFTNYLGPIRSGSQISGALIVAQDVTDIKRAQQELFGAQRLAAIGTLAAGVAHEINTPLQFIGDSLDFLQEASRDTQSLVTTLLELRTALESKVAEPALRTLVKETHAAQARADLEYLVEHVPKAFARCADGLGRVTSIVRSMKEFSHPAQQEMVPVDLNRAIMATLTVARSEYKYVADVVTELAQLPPVTCYVNDINQVVLNIVVNAAHAIADVVGHGGDKKGVITVRTAVEAGQVLIAISDTGGGIPETIRDRIFDPFFTTKVVGRGTGQGLAIAWAAVKDKHAGELTFESRVGIGTTFFIRLPIQGRPVAAT